MTKELLEIERECKIAGIKDDLATFYSFSSTDIGNGDADEFMYILEKDGVEHRFIFTLKKVRISPNLYNKLRVDNIIHIPNLKTLTHKVMINSECIGRNFAFVP